MRVPLATYRLQLNPSFRFVDARAQVPYLARLGISDIYASPILQATPGSLHGYDVTDPNELNPGLGSIEDFQSLAKTVGDHRMGWVQDIVPNHMAYASENRMLMDVFESGPHSRFYDFFDVFRDHPEMELRTRVLAPFLGALLEECLRNGQLRLVLDPEGLAIRYYDWRLPLALKSYEVVLRPRIEQLEEELGGADRRLATFVQVCDAFAGLAETADSPQRRVWLHDTKDALWELYERDGVLRSHLDGVLEFFNHVPEGPVEGSPLHALLEQQVFKLVFWQVAHETINYRRFFYLSDFISLRIEDPDVFQTAQSRILDLARAGVFTGLRIDHVDGLYDPRGYLARLRETLPDVYLVVEKILELDEALPTGWSIQGTSGYKFCNYVNGIFCRQENEQAFTNVYHEFIGSELDYDRLLYAEKRKILEQRMAGEVAYLSHLFMEAFASSGPHDAECIRKALTALMATFPVYRTYVDESHFTDQDREFLATAIESAAQRVPECAEDLERIGSLLLSEPQSGTEQGTPTAPQRFLMRFQQFTGPAMAKGFEDTLLYVYNRLVSLNEVGGSPNEFGLSLERFHRFNQARAQNWPFAMNATSTHDSKRGEDIRARLNVLSEIPDRWQQAITRWSQINALHKQPYGETTAPYPNDEYMLYQTLIGAMPFDAAEHEDFPRRVQEYTTKVIREAKAHGSWVDPNEEYEQACLRFIERILDRSASPAFWADFLPFQEEISEYGVHNTLSQTLLKITCPGLPDFYQGAELWDLNLVDPDNRRAVDFEQRARLLQEVEAIPTDDNREQLAALLRSKRDGRVKLFLIQRGLKARRENWDLFEAAEYVPASVAGARAQHVVAFFRTSQGRYALTIVPRFPTSLIRPGESPTGRDVWSDTRINLPADGPSQWHDAITGKLLSTQDELFIGDALTDFPVAVLVGQAATDQVRP